MAICRWFMLTSTRKETRELLSLKYNTSLAEKICLQSWSFYDIMYEDMEEHVMNGKFNLANFVQARGSEQRILSI